MATYTKPTDIPRWADTSLNVVEPAEAKKDAGWLFEEIPPSSYENWKAKLNGEWWKWIDERFDDGTTADDLRSLFPLEIQDADFKLVLNGNPAIVFDAGDNDFMQYDRSSNTFEYRIANSIEYEFGAAGADWNGNNLTGVGALDGTGDLTMGSITMTGFSVDASGNVSTQDLQVTGHAYVSGAIGYDADNYIQFFSGTTDEMHITLAGGGEYEFATDELRFGGNNATEIGLVHADDGEFESGLVVGFAGTPAADQVRVGDANFRLWFDGTDPYIYFDSTAGPSNDYLVYDRSANNWSFVISGASEFVVATDGIRVLNGLYVGSLGTAATSGEVRMSGNCHVGGAVIYFGIGSNDYISHSEGSNDFNFVIDAATEYEFGASQADFHSNNVIGVGSLTVGGAISGATSIDGTGDLTMGSITMSGNIYTTGNIGRDSTDYIDFTDNTSMRIVVNNVEEFTFGSIALDLHGNNISAGLNIDGTGDLTMGTITMTGFSVDADGDMICKSITAGSGVGQFRADVANNRIRITTDTAVPTGLTDEGILIFEGDSVDAMQINHAMPFGGGSTVLKVKGEGYDNEYCKLTTYSFPTLEPFNNYEFNVWLWNFYKSGGAGLDKVLYCTQSGNAYYSIPTAGIVAAYRFESAFVDATEVLVDELKIIDLGAFPGIFDEHSMVCVEDRLFWNSSGGTYGICPIVMNDERWSDRADRTITADSTEEKLGVHVIVPYSTIDYTSWEMVVFAHIANKTGTPDDARVKVYWEDQGGSGEATVCDSGTLSAPTNNEGIIVKLWGTAYPSDQCRLYCQIERFSTLGSRINSEFDGAGTVFEHDRTSNTYVRIGGTSGTTGSFDIVIDHITFKYM